MIQKQFFLSPRFPFNHHYIHFQRKGWLLGGVRVKAVFTRRQRLAFSETIKEGRACERTAGRSDGYVWKHTEGQTWSKIFPLGQATDTGSWMLPLLTMSWPDGINGNSMSILGPAQGTFHQVNVHSAPSSTRRSETGAEGSRDLRTSGPREASLGPERSHRRLRTNQLSTSGVWSNNQSPIRLSH